MQSLRTCLAWVEALSFCHIVRWLLLYMCCKNEIMSYCHKNTGYCLVDMGCLLTFASSDINII